MSLGAFQPRCEQKATARQVAGRVRRDERRAEGLRDPSPSGDTGTGAAAMWKTGQPCAKRGGLYAKTPESATDRGQHCFCGRPGRADQNP